jgi:hypothetical protein
MYESLIVAAFVPHLNRSEQLVLLLLFIASRFPGWWLRLLLAVEATLELRDRRRAAADRSHERRSGGPPRRR